VLGARQLHAAPLATALAMDGAMTRFLAPQETLCWDTPHLLLFSFAVLWLEQVHPNQSAQAPVAQPHGDLGPKAPKRIAGHEVDAPLVPCSQRARKWWQMQLAKLRSANNPAAEANLQQVTAVSKVAAISIACFRWVRFSLQCSGAFISALACRSMSLLSYLCTFAGCRA
jgi:hypothetical protein